MNAIESHLHQATKGLWGKHKQAVREELEAHILERTRKHELLGMHHEDAIQQALAELGNPSSLARSFAQTHTLPGLNRVLLNCALCALLLGVLLPGFPASPSISRQPDQSKLMAGVNFSGIPLAQPGQAQFQARPTSKGAAAIENIPTHLEPLTDFFLRPTRKPLPPSPPKTIPPQAPKPPLLRR